MKKGLLSLLVVALTVVGCQDYDDQFDSLNKEIKSLQTDLETITGITKAVALISADIKALEGKMVTDADITGILAKVAEVKTAVAAIPAPADISGITTEVSGLNTEIDSILSKLTKLASSTGGTYSGPLNIKSLVQLDAAEDIVDTEEDGPLMTITGNINITAGQTDLKLAANLLRIQAILNKLKVVTGNVTITGVDSNMTADELLFITGSLNVAGKAAFALPKLNTVDGPVDFGLYGPLSYPLLSSVTKLELSGNTASITTVDFSGLTNGVVTTGQSSLVLPASVSVKVGSLPISVTLAKAVTVQAHGVEDATSLSISAPKATELIIKAAKHTGSVTIVANLAAVTLLTKEIGYSNIHALSVTADALTTIRGESQGATISATSFSATALKTVNASLTLISISTVALPALATLTASLTGTKVSAFTAGKLAVSATATNLIDLKAGATVSVKTLGSLVALTDSNTISGLTVTAQANDLILAPMVKLVTLNYTSSVQAGTLNVSSTLVSMTTLTLGSAGKLTTLTVSGTNMVDLTTDGQIMHTIISNNAKLETMGFGHSFVPNADASTVTFTGNVFVQTLDMSTLAKVQKVMITGNTSLTSVVPPASATVAERITPGALFPLEYTITGNGFTGTYSGTVVAAGTSPERPWYATSAAITAQKVFINNHTATNSITFSLDIDKIDFDTDGKFDDGAFSAKTDRPITELGTISSTTMLAKF
jgi:hypothetical protein